MSVPYVVREARGDADIESVRRLVRAHGDARADVPGVEFVYADADRMPGPYVPPMGELWLAVLTETANSDPRSASTAAPGLARDTAIGCVALRPVGKDVAEVKRMFVDAQYRGLGVGRRLMNTLIEKAVSCGYGTLRLGTLAEMTEAQELYRSLGFTPIERYRSDELIDTRFYELDLRSRG